MTDFGRYQLGRKLGQGGMAEVFLARQLVAAGTERTVVIKRVRRQLAANPEFLRLFVEEARLSMQLNHGNLVQVIDFGEHDGQHFLSMEWVDGPTAGALLHLAKTRGFTGVPAPIAASIAIELCKGLHYAHTRADVHRDISPDNVLLSWEGQVKLSDFGIARAAMEGRARTDPDIFRGRLEFCAPEQAMGLELDPRTDVYAVGVLLSLLVLGRNPIGTAAQAVRIASGAAAAPDFPVWAVDREFARIIDHCVARAPAGRFESAQALQGALQSWVSSIAPKMSVSAVSDFLAVLSPDDLDQRGLSSRPMPAFRAWLELWQPRAPVTAPAEAPMLADVWSPPRLSAESARAVVGAVLLLGGLGAAALFLRPDPPPPVPARVLASAPTPVSQVGPGAVVLRSSGPALHLPLRPVFAPAAPTAAWEVSLSGAQAFVSFFSLRGDLLSTRPVVSERVLAPAGATRASAWLVAERGDHPRALIRLGEDGRLEAGDEVELGVEVAPAQRLRITELDPAVDYALAVQGQASVLVVLGPGGAFHPREPLGGMGVVEPGGQRVFSGAAFLSVSLLTSAASEPRASRVVVEKVVAPTPAPSSRVRR
jgi:serine/threonine-protein kinase